MLVLRMSPLLKVRALALLAAAVLPSHAANVALFGPVPYRRRADSPFYAGIQRGTIVLEDFEDRTLAAGVSVTTGTIAGGQGVDEDDGGVDGIGFNRVWFTNTGAPGLPSPFGIEMKFSADDKGRYPNYVGFALLGYNQISLATEYYQFYQFFDPDGNSLTPDPLSSLVPRVPDDTPTSSSIGDRFVGAWSETGIARVIIGATNRFDHLQFGYSIPEPETSALTAGMMLLLARRRRRTP